MPPLLLTSLSSCVLLISFIANITVISWAVHVRSNNSVNNYYRLCCKEFISKPLNQMARVYFAVVELPALIVRLLQW